VPEQARYMISDVHLIHPRCDMRGLDVMLTCAERESASLFILGDLFDAYLRALYVVRSRPDIRLRLLRMQALLEAYIAGNHDGEARHSEGLPGPTNYPTYITTIDGVRWHMEHGHLIGKWAKLFRALDYVDQTAAFRTVVRSAHTLPCVATVGRKAEDPDFIAKAAARARRAGCTVAVVGHTHQQRIIEDRAGTPVTVVNLGSCIDRAEWTVWRDGEFHEERA